MCSQSVLGLGLKTIDIFFFSENHQGLDFLDVLDKLGVKEGEAGELVLVEVHHEQLVGGGEVCTLTGELSVKIGHVLPVFLKEDT